MKRDQVLENAQKAMAARESIYGSPQVNYERQAAFANIILKDKLKPDFPLSARDMVMLHLLAIKASRLVETPEHEDSHIDVAGYAAILSEIA
jgi:hypothetical protein